MANKVNWKAFMISEKLCIVAQVDVHSGTQIRLTMQFGLSVTMLNMIMKDHASLKRRCARCGSFSKQWKSLKHLPVEELE
jgi:hypothetical protein